MALQAAAVSLVVGSLVWLEDPDEAWVDGEVTEIKGEDIKVLCTSGKTVGFLFTFLNGYIQCRCQLSSCLNLSMLEVIFTIYGFLSYLVALLLITSTFR